MQNLIAALAFVLVGFLSGTAAEAQTVICVTQQQVVVECPPEFAPTLNGTAQVKLEHKPVVCLEYDTRKPLQVSPYILMTHEMQANNTLIKVMDANWDYAFSHENGVPYDIGTVITGQCFNHQEVKHGTVISNWFICKDWYSGRWIRYWSATKPIVDNGRYDLVIYHAEYVESFETPPPPHASWPRPPS